MISVTVITRNEAGNIGDCIRSVQWADEIIVVDQFSSDGTPDITASLGAKVFEEPWKGFAGQKNSALEKAAGEWVLSLDADERVPFALREEIETAINDKGAPNGFFIARRNHFAGKWIRYGGWYPDYCLRLFRREAGGFEERAVHERVVVEGPVGYLKNPLDHFTYRSAADFVLRMERYSRLAASEMQEGKRRFLLGSLLLRPPFTFLSMYVLRLGFLDGMKGLFLASSYAYYTFLKYYRFGEADLDPPEKTGA